MRGCCKGRGFEGGTVRVVLQAVDMQVGRAGGGGEEDVGGHDVWLGGLWERLVWVGV